jgi:hypothetical protein
MFLYRIVFFLYHSAPEGAAVVYIKNSDIFSSELHHTSMGHARLVCTHLYIFHTLWKVGSTGSCLLQRIALHGLTLALTYHTILRKRNIDEFRLYVLLLTSSIKGHLLSLKFRPHRATRTPHRQHRKNSHSWHKVNSTAQQKGSKLYKMAKKLQGALHPLGAHARTCNIFVPGAHMRGCGVKNPRTCQRVHL